MHEQHIRNLQGPGNEVIDSRLVSRQRAPWYDTEMLVPAVTSMT